MLDNPYALTADPVTPGNFDGYPSYRSTIVRRPSFAAAGATLLNPGPPLPDLLVHPLNYNPANGEEMRLLNPRYPGGEVDVPDELFLDLDRDPTGNTWNWSFRTVKVSPGEGWRRRNRDRLQRARRARSVRLRDQPRAGSARRVHAVR